MIAQRSTQLIDLLRNRLSITCPSSYQRPLHTIISVITSLKKLEVSVLICSSILSIIIFVGHVLCVSSLIIEFDFKTMLELRE